MCPSLGSRNRSPVCMFPSLQPTPFSPEGTSVLKRNPTLKFSHYSLPFIIVLSHMYVSLSNFSFSFFHFKLYLNGIILYVFFSYLHFFIVQHVFAIHFHCYSIPFYVYATTYPFSYQWTSFPIFGCYEQYG